MNDLEENQPDPDRHPKRNHPQQLLTDYVLNYDVEHYNLTD